MFRLTMFRRRFFRRIKCWASSIYQCDFPVLQHSETKRYTNLNCYILCVEPARMVGHMNAYKHIGPKSEEEQKRNKCIFEVELGGNLE